MRRVVMADGAPCTLPSSLSTSTLISLGLLALELRRVLMATEVADVGACDPATIGAGGGRRRLSLLLLLLVVGKLEPRVREKEAAALVLLLVDGASLEMALLCLPLPTELLCARDGTPSRSARRLKRAVCRSEFIDGADTITVG